MVKLIKSGFHKDRTILAVFMLIMILATFLLHTGLMASTYEDLYNEYAAEEDLSDMYVFLASHGEDTDDLIESKDYIERYRQTDVVNLSSFTLTTSNSSKEKDAGDWIVSALEDNCACNGVEFVERDENAEGKKIYLNIYTAYSNDLCVGDKVYIDSDMGNYEYTVAGIFQHLYMGSTYTYFGAMVENEEFKALQEDSKKYVQSGGTVLCDKVLNVYIKDGYDIEKSLNDLNNSLLNEKGLFSNGFTAQLGIEAYTVIPNVVAGFMAAFAVIMLVISVIMIIFTISNNLGRDIINIGALRAVGFTVGQIRAALIAEYTILGSVGSAIGIVLSYALYPMLDRMFIREISGMIWKTKFFAVQTFGILIGVLAVIIVTALISTMKIRKLHPATALRFGLSSNSFKKNHLPLDTAKGELNFLLAIKSSLQSIGQGIIVFCIVAVVSFVTMFSAVLYYNTKFDISRLQRMINGDVPDANVYLKDFSNEEAHKVIDKLNEIEDVSQAYMLCFVPAEIEDNKINLIYISDPDCIDIGLCDGEMLKENNETVIGSSLADILGVGVGDEVELNYNNQKQRFLITGVQQSALNSRIYISEDAVKEMGGGAECSNIRLRVNNADSDKVDAVLAEINAWGDSNITSTKNEYKFQHSNENTPVFAVSFIVLILVLLNVAIIILVIRLLMKTVFIKREKEFGIKKAVGFTSTQLRYQLSLSLMPTTLIAAAAGAISGYFLVNPLFTQVLSGYGIKDADLIIKPLLSVITAIAVAVMVFIFSFVMSGKMKKVSAYKLIQE